VAKSYDGDAFKAKLSIIYDVLIRKEQEKKPPHYVHSSSHRSGLEVMHFLFDLINHIAGYTHKYYEELADVISHDELALKYRAEKEKYLNNI